MRVARFTSTLRLSYDLHEIQLTQERLVGAIVSMGEHAHAYSQHSFKASGSPEVLNSTIMLKKLGIISNSTGQ